MTREEWKDWAAPMNKPKPKSHMECINILLGMTPEQAKAAAESAELQAKMCRKYGNDNL